MTDGQSEACEANADQQHFYEIACREAAHVIFCRKRMESIKRELSQGRRNPGRQSLPKYRKTTKDLLRQKLILRISLDVIREMGYQVKRR